MIYSLTEKLKFDDNPKLEIEKGKFVEVKTEAETVLSLLDIMKSSDEIETALKAVDLLFNEKDKKIVTKLKWKDFTETIATAINLALGEDPDEEGKKLGEE